MIDQQRQGKHSFELTPRSRLLALAASLALLPLPAHAQYIPPAMVAVALSPVLVLVLCVVLGFLDRSLRVAALHAVLVCAWVLLFGLAAYFVENDYVIWTPIAIYFLHALLLLVLVGMRSAARLAGRA